MKTFGVIFRINPNWKLWLSPWFIVNGFAYCYFSFKNTKTNENQNKQKTPALNLDYYNSFVGSSSAFS